MSSPRWSPECAGTLRHLIHLSPKRRGFANPDFTSMRLHYQDQVLQIHVMAEFLQRGLETMADARCCWAMD